MRKTNGKRQGGKKGCNSIEPLVKFSIKLGMVFKEKDFL